MARALEMGVVAEGVETEDQVRHLRGLGCDRAQGYYFGRPGEAATITPLLRSADPPWSSLPPGRQPAPRA
jgi:EAL domain-containing protein (putative c-di-GMP-specific phosphodiesterase class I)